MYYNKVGFFTIGLFRQPTGGGEEVKIFDFIQLLAIGDWALTDKGVYLQKTMIIEAHYFSIECENKKAG